MTCLYKCGDACAHEAFAGFDKAKVSPISEADGASVDEPASTWPDGGPARPAVVTVWRIAEGSKRTGA